MGSPSRLYRIFVDASGVRWGVEARVLGEGTDAIPVGFAFTSQRGEHRVLDGATSDCLACEQFRDFEWSQLLAASRLVRSPAPSSARSRYQVTRFSGHW